MKRLVWLDLAKALAILAVVYFHFFTTYFEHPPEPATGGGGLLLGAITFIELAWLKISGMGFHAVGAFIILSGWALMESTARRADSGKISWGGWYFARFIRLYPMYWVAHLVYLISPFVARLEPVDSRIIWSLLGLRFVDITMNFMYLNAAWWYFAMLIQFVFLFPILFWIARKLGPWPFLFVGCAVGFFVRYLLLIVYPQDGLWLLGGFAICRLPEFALGMALGAWHSRSSAKAERFLLRGGGLIAGLLLYPAALQLYHNGYTYIFVDFATGACCFLVVVGLAGIIARFPRPASILALVGAYSYGIFLVHQPYAIWLGLHVRQDSIWMFFVFAAGLLTVMSLWGIFLEKATNALVNKFMRPKTRPA
jgi:peptidoglycan/LPS O-acetylase OafA/YrhL